MSPEKWQSIKQQVQSAFSDCKSEKITLEEPEVGEIESLEFTGPLGLMRVEYLVKPLVLGKNVSGSRRIGSHHEVDYIYSKDEFTHTLRAYRWDEVQDDWLEIDLKGSFNL
jgi:hypothetical protein